jgi:hypothetical protein
VKTLKSIKLINFQSHKNALINFAGPGCLTVITGPSDSGKSAVIRALRWVFYNVPQGDGFIFNAEDRCTVSLVYDNGTTVERIRSRGGINRYIVNGQAFEGFGTGVPVEVQRATGIRKLEIGDQNFLLNLSEQLDGPFLGKTVSGPSRAKVLGKLAGTEEIDYAGKQVGTDLYRANRQQEGLCKDIERLDKQIGQYGFINAWEAALWQAEAKLRNVRDNVVEIERLKALKQQWEDACRKILVLNMVVAGLQEVDKGLDLVRLAQNALTKGNALAVLRAGHFKALLESERSKAILIRLDPVFRYASPMVEKVVEKSVNASTYTALYDRYDSSSISVLSLRKLVQRLSGIENVVNHLQQAFVDNTQSSRIQALYGLYERFDHSSLICKRLVQNLSEIESARNYFDLAGYEKSTRVSLEVYIEQYAQTNRSLLTHRAALTRLHNIDSSDNHLQQAFADNLQQIRNKEHLQQRAIHIQTINQSLQILGNLTEEVNIAESEYLNLMSTLGKCPTCGSDIDINKLREVI